MATTSEITEEVARETRIAVVLREDLLIWQKLNVTAFLVSGIAATTPESIGQPYVDGTGNHYLPMFGQPVMVFAAEASSMPTILERALSRGVVPSIYTEQLFSTGNDRDNRAAVSAVEHNELDVVGFAFRCPRNTAAKITKDLSLHS